LQRCGACCSDVVRVAAMWCVLQRCGACCSDAARVARRTAACNSTAAQRICAHRRTATNRRSAAAASRAAAHRAPYAVRAAARRRCAWRNVAAACATRERCAAGFRPQRARAHAARMHGTAPRTQPRVHEDAHARNTDPPGAPVMRADAHTSAGRSCAAQRAHYLALVRRHAKQWMVRAYLCVAHRPPRTRRADRRRYRCRRGARGGMRRAAERASHRDLRRIDSISIDPHCGVITL
jgi:hypothetical protein